MEYQPKQPKMLHANHAKVAKGTQISSVYATNTITMNTEKDGVICPASEENVEIAKKEVDMNHL